METGRPANSVTCSAAKEGTRSSNYHERGTPADGQPTVSGKAAGGAVKGIRKQAHARSGFQAVSSHLSARARPANGRSLSFPLLAAHVSFSPETNDAHSLPPSQFPLSPDHPIPRYIVVRHQQTAALPPPSSLQRYFYVIGPEKRELKQDGRRDGETDEGWWTTTQETAKTGREGALKELRRLHGEATPSHSTLPSVHRVYPFLSSRTFVRFVRCQSIVPS